MCHWSIVMPISRIPPTQGQLDRWFGPPPPLEPGVFEFALVLGGTVSAGAYTAGAIDFLIEALDCLSKAQQEGRAPRHKVRLKLIAGASGGGVNAAIAARALAYEYPHVTHSTSIGTGGSGNPFYDIWVNTLLRRQPAGSNSANSPARRLPFRRAFRHVR